MDTKASSNPLHALFAHNSLFLEGKKFYAAMLQINVFSVSRALKLSDVVMMPHLLLSSEQIAQCHTNYSLHFEIPLLPTFGNSCPCTLLHQRNTNKERRGQLGGNT
jgi:hypothetical protein